MRIRWTDAAVRDFTQICDYISERGSAVTARRVALSVYQGVDILAKFPESGRTGRHPRRENSYSQATIPSCIPPSRRNRGDSSYRTRGGTVDVSQTNPLSPIAPLILRYVSSSASG